MNINSNPSRTHGNKQGKSNKPRTEKNGRQNQNHNHKSVVDKKPADKATRLTVTESAELLSFVMEKLPSRGRNSIKSILSRGQISVNGKAITQFNHPLEPGQEVVINWEKIVEEVKLLGIRIIHEDDDIMVINKDSGMLSIATATEKENTAYHQLTDHVRRTDPKARIFVVHRLDRDTSGVMMFAKNEEAQQKMQNAWQDAVEERTYVALVEGNVKRESGTITSWLKESKTLLMYSSQYANDGQKAVTHYKLLQTNREFSLLEVNLETGRKNQIRVHMSDIGHPVVGDKKYGSRKNIIGRLGLHARVLAFQHPTTGEKMRFETKVPEKFQRVVQDNNNNSR
ncbi:RluA family pseudouridine synthase [Paenibacillus sp. N1-5-1-14]|uniref:RluA family pseudouridine synthase n=1 Tax=Paenibacillus radicibacter TaxID=2972488 RepID=UPI002158B4F7|nr:RluA family pseudouridine synthase [Paenibacillus radicibacter]MCR8645628.1 RluA family pseudouridine synthase [Paenibacillus radicibacter]